MAHPKFLFSGQHVAGPCRPNRNPHERLCFPSLLLVQCTVKIAKSQIISSLATFSTRPSAFRVSSRQATPPSSAGFRNVSTAPTKQRSDPAFSAITVSDELFQPRSDCAGCGWLRLKENVLMYLVPPTSRYRRSRKYLAVSFKYFLKYANSRMCTELIRISKYSENVVHR